MHENQLKRLGDYDSLSDSSFLLFAEEYPARQKFTFDSRFHVWLSTPEHDLPVQTKT